MAAITLNYDGRNPVVKNLIYTAILAGATPVGMTDTSALDRALKEVSSGKVLSANPAKNGKKVLA